MFDKSFLFMYNIINKRGGTYMTLGDIIKDYRQSHNLSMDAFSNKSGISKAYISLLEKNKHPKTGKSIAPSIQCIKQAADGMDMDFNTLFSMIDGDVDLKEENNLSLSRRDERDIGKILENTKEQLLSQEGLMFDGKPASPEAIESILSAMQIGMELAKKKNKEKYTPKKYKKD